MDDLLSWLLPVGAWLGVRWFLSLFANASPGASGAQQEMASDAIPEAAGPLAARIVPTSVDIGDRQVQAYDVEVCGQLGSCPMEPMAVVTSLFDTTTDEVLPVLSGLEWQQEPHGEAFQTFVELGVVPPDSGYLRWSRVSRIFPEMLISPYAGGRKLDAVVRLLPVAQRHLIDDGFHSPAATVVATCSAPLWLELTEKGWREAAEQRAEAREIIVRIAVALAGRDSGIQAEEAKVIQEWIRRQLEHLNGEFRERMRHRLNTAFKEAFFEAQQGTLIADVLVRRLASFEMPSANRALLELLTEVSAADADMATGELSMIRDVGRQLGVEPEELRAMSEKAFLSTSVAPGAEASAEALLGIEPGWDHGRIQAHLRKEFAKWNGRIQALQDPVEREKAQTMLDRIGELRKKYQ